MNNLPMLRIDGQTGLPILIRRRTNLGERVTGAIRGGFFTASSAIGTVFDGFVNVVSPETALRRQHFRDLMSLRSLGGYDATDRNRLNAHRLLNTRDPDAELGGKQGRIRAFAREEVRNNAIARNLKTTHANNTVGDADVGQGCTVDPAVLNEDGTTDKNTNQILKTKWQEVRDHLEYTGRWGFADMCVINDYELTEAGEVLDIIHDRPAPGSNFPLSIELLEPDRLPTSNEQFTVHSAEQEVLMAGTDGMPIINKDGVPTKHYVRHGIEYDENRQINAFHLLKTHPGSEFFGGSIETQRVPADRVIHYFRPDRAEQTRGVSWFVVVLNLLADLRDLLSWELVAARMQAMFGVHFNGSGPQNMPFPAPGNGSSNPPRDALGNPVTQLQPGLMTYGEQKAEMYGGNRPGGTFLPFFQSLIRLCGAGFGIGYSATSKDFSQGSYSALRQEDNEDDRSYRAAQGLHARHFIKRVWVQFVRKCAAMGLIDQRAYRKNPARFERCKIGMPGRKHINPLQEMTAEAVALRNGIKDPDEVVNVSGAEPEDRINRLAEIKNLAEEKGVLLGWVSGEVRPKLNQQNPDDPDDLSEEKVLTDSLKETAS